MDVGAASSARWRSELMRSARSRASSLPVEIMRRIGETYAAADPGQAGLQA
jgi:hypothetical protein